MCSDDPITNQLHNRLEENGNTAVNSTVTKHNREEKMMKQKEEIHLDSLWNMMKFWPFILLEYERKCRLPFWCKNQWISIVNLKTAPNHIHTFLISTIYSNIYLHIFSIVWPPKNKNSYLLYYSFNLFKVDLTLKLPWKYWKRLLTCVRYTLSNFYF